MTLLLPVTINGVPYEAHAEYTKGPIGQDFLNSLAVFEQIFNLRGEASELTDLINNGSFAEELAAAMWGGDVTIDGVSGTVRGLITLAEDGMLDPNDIIDPNRPHFLTVQMAGAVDQLIQSLKAAGVPITSNTNQSVTITAENILNWRNLAVSSDAIRRILQDAIDIGENYNRSMQALVELIYVKTGNQILSDNLEDLEIALTTTRDSLETLADLQNLHNNITAKDKGQFEEFAAIAYKRDGATAFVEGEGTSEESMRGIVQWGDLFFAPLDPEISGMITPADRTDFLSLRNELRVQISALTPKTDDLEDKGTLLSKIRLVYDDIQNAITKAGGSGSIESVKRALLFWILDSYSANPQDITFPPDFAAVNDLNAFATTINGFLGTVSWNAIDEPIVFGLESTILSTVSFPDMFNLTAFNEAPQDYINGLIADVEDSGEDRFLIPPFPFSFGPVDRVDNIGGATAATNIAAAFALLDNPFAAMGLEFSFTAISAALDDIIDYERTAVFLLGNDPGAIPDDLLSFLNVVPGPLLNPTPLTTFRNSLNTILSGGSKDVELAAFQDSLNTILGGGGVISIPNASLLTSSLESLLIGVDNAEANPLRDTLIDLLANTPRPLLQAELEAALSGNGADPQLATFQSSLDTIVGSGGVITAADVSNLKADLEAIIVIVETFIAGPLPEADALRDSLDALLNSGSIADRLLLLKGNLDILLLGQGQDVELATYKVDLDNIIGAEPVVIGSSDASQLRSDLTAIITAIGTLTPEEIDSLMDPLNALLDDTPVNAFLGSFDELVGGVVDSLPLGQFMIAFNILFDGSPVDPESQEADDVTSRFEDVARDVENVVSEEDISFLRILLENLIKDEVDTTPDTTPIIGFADITLNIEEAELRFADFFAALSGAGLPLADFVTEKLINPPPTTTFNSNLGSPGSIQRSITGAITAGQSLNDTQKEEVRRYLFIFEEYYKSASAILNKITQILERIAQGIAR